MYFILAANKANEGALEVVPIVENAFVFVALLAISILAFAMVRSVISAGVEVGYSDEDGDEIEYPRETFESAQEYDEVDEYAEHSPWDPWGDEGAASTDEDFKSEEDREKDDLREAMRELYFRE